MARVTFTHRPAPSPLERLAELRWEKSQTFAYDGVAGVPADSALAAVTGFVVAAQIAPPAGLTTWKLADGEFRAWGVEEVIAYGVAIRAHIQACFDREQVLTGVILASEAPESVDITTGWPG